MSIGGAIVLLVMVGGFSIVAWHIWLPAIRSSLQYRGACESLPGLGVELGLRHKPADKAGGLGSWAGEYQGYRVEITPDTHDKLKVHLRPGLAYFYLMAPYSALQRMFVRAFVAVGAMKPDDMSSDRRGTRTVAFGDKALDSYFFDRVARAPVVAQLVSGPVRDALDTFVARWKPHLDSLTACHTHLVCTPRVGRAKFNSSITPDQVRALLPDLLKLSRALEAKIEAE